MPPNDVDVLPAYPSSPGGTSHGLVHRPQAATGPAGLRPLSEPKTEAHAMPMPVAELERRLRDAFPEAAISVTDLAGDGDHYAARIRSSRFKGLSRVRQHQMVYEALDGKMGGELHALALQTEAADEDET